MGEGGGRLNVLDTILLATQLHGLGPVISNNRCNFITGRIILSHNFWALEIEITQKNQKFNSEY